MWDWIGPALVGAIVTYLFTRIREWQTASSKARALLRGIEIELERAEECVSAYLKDTLVRQIWSPNYRLETDFLKSSVPVLIELGALTSSEVRNVHRLYIHACEVNRSLEELSRLLGRHDSPGIERQQQETSRCRGKCNHVVEWLPSARKSVSDALSRLAWFERQD